MKRKPPVPRQAAENRGNAPLTPGPAQAAPEPAAPAPYTAADTVWVVLFSLLLLLAMTVQTGRVSVILCFAALTLSLPIGRAPLRNLRQRLCVPMLGFLGYGLMNGLAAIYSDFGAYAVAEYYKFLPAFALAALLLVRFEKKHVRPLLWGFAAVCAVVSLLCVDSSCGVGLFDAANTLVHALGGGFINLEPLTDRVTGIYNNSNVSAGILGLASLVSLYLADTAEGVRRRLPACLLLGINAMGFFLAVSRAAILCFGLSLLVWLALAGKGNRLRLFLRMLVSAASVIALSIPSMLALAAGSGLPLWLTLVSGGLIFLLDWGLVTRLLALAGKYLRGAAIVTGAVAAVYVVAALTVSGPHTIDATGRLSRSADLAPGTYTVSGDWDGDPTLQILVMDEASELLGRYWTAYSGPLEGASFEIPEETRQISVLIDDAEGTEIRSVVFSDGTELRLGYPLVPAFLASRLQVDVFMGRSVSMRLQYMKDAWTLFSKSPLIGHGLGSTEGLYTSVQPFYYESKYVHSHLLQYLSDTGLLGTAAFLLFALGGLWLALRAVRREKDPLAVMLVACSVMMHAHGLLEITFSVRSYLCVALSVMALPIVLYARPFSERTAKAGGVVLGCCVWLYLAVFGGLLVNKRAADRDLETFSTNSADKFLEKLSSCISRDVFDPEELQLTYVSYTATANDPEYNYYLFRYVEDLRESGTYEACSGLARYYYLPRGEYEELFACSREAVAQEASAREAWNYQMDFYREEVLPTVGPEDAQTYLDGVLELEAYLAEYSDGRLEKVPLTNLNTAFVELVHAAIKDGLTAEEICRGLMAKYHPEETPAP